MLCSLPSRILHSLSYSRIFYYSYSYHHSQSHRIIPNQHVQFYRFRSNVSHASHQWLQRQSKDPYVRSAMLAGYRARSAFKLLEIQERYSILSLSSIIVDLGCAPGSWLQICKDINYTPAQINLFTKDKYHTLYDSLWKQIDIHHYLQSMSLSTTISTTTMVPGSTTIQKKKRSSIFNLAGEKFQSKPIPSNTSSSTTLSTSSSSSSSLSSSELLLASHPLHTILSQVPVIPRIIGIDLNYVESIPGILLLRGDFTKPYVRTFLQSIWGKSTTSTSTTNSSSSSLMTNNSIGYVDTVLSDMAHAFHGDNSLDSIKQMHLAWQALLFALNVLKSDTKTSITDTIPSQAKFPSTSGSSSSNPTSFVVKVRHCDEYIIFRSAMNKLFDKVHEIKPPASRTESAETYFVGIHCYNSLLLSSSSTNELNITEELSQPDQISSYKLLQERKKLNPVLYREYNQYLTIGRLLRLNKQELLTIMNHGLL